MNVIIFGASGMIGQGVLRECLQDLDVQQVVAIGRAPLGQTHAKLREIVRANLLDYSDIASKLSGFDACFFCLGVSSTGMSETDYRRVTVEIPLAAARALVTVNPGMTFVYVSGAGADSTERGRLMWARVKGHAENALFALPFKAVFSVRPAFVQPLHGIRSRTALYNAAYGVLAPLYPLLKRLAPSMVTTTEQLGRAMLAVARTGWRTRILENRDINAAG